MEVLVLSVGKERAKTRVFAILEADGSGRICVKEEAFEYPTDFEDAMDFTAKQMERLHYRKPGERVTPAVIASAVAKFWYANELGPLIVAPHGILFQQMDKARLQHAGKRWLRQEEEYAFVLPMTAKRGSASNKRKAEKTYGDLKSAALANGGGPFLLEDSDIMVEDFLHKLGFMDTSLNTDLSEAIQVFSSVGQNKRNLRRVGITPADLMSYPSSMSILRSALLSNESGGEWQLPPSDKLVCDYLIAQGLLPVKGATKEEIFQALKKHSRKLGLPNLKTYNGQVMSLNSHLNPANPSRRQ